MKSTNIDNTIKFIDKKIEYEGKSNISKISIKKLRSKNKIIRYKQHKKMKASEARKQRILNSNIYKYRKIIFSIIVIVFGLFISTYLWKNFFKPFYTQANYNNFKVENENLSNSDVQIYSSIIKKSIKDNLDITYKINIERLHKNGNLLFAKGYFNIPDKGNINFDMILKKHSPYSLTINGNEYLKK